jgi:Fe-S-cluster containining protein
MRGWIRPDGGCLNYDDATKSCKIYATRPDLCHVDREWKRSGASDVMEREHYYTIIERFCDESHELVYGQPRERGEDCKHG